jgi:hypothetical protein
MNSRELVKRTLEFDNPPRIPRQLWLQPWAQLHYPAELARIQQDFPDDLIGAPGYFKQKPKVVGDPYVVGAYVDEWGCIFENRQAGIVGEVKQPLLEKWVDVDKVRVPEELLTIDIEEINSFCRNSDKFIYAGCCPRPFERLQFIRGTENVFMDLMDQPEELFVLLNRMHHFFLKKMELWVQTEVDGLMFMDDWGSQFSLLISPDIWRKIFKPFYKDYIDLAHSHGKYILMHSDGYIMKILPDLVELGLDAINSQIFCMDLEEIARQFAGKITFWGEIDRQHILPEGMVEDVKKAVHDVHHALYRNGGVIAQCEFSPGAKPENVYEVFKTWDGI